MHHHGSAGDSGAIGAFLLVLLVVTTTFHLGGRLASGDRRVDSYLAGHALMTAGMAWMLLPASGTSMSNAGLALVFAAAGGYFLVHLLRNCTKVSWRAALGHGDLTVGHAAMAYMLGPARIRSSPATAFLVAYFLLLGLASTALVVGRGAALDLPGGALEGTAQPPEPRRDIARWADGVSSRSAAAHAAMGIAMVYMLARL